MNPESNVHDVGHADQLAQYVLGLLPGADADRVEQHEATCGECRREIASLRATVDSFPLWPAELLQPSPRVWERIAGRIGVASPRRDAAAGAPQDRAPDWIKAGPGLDYVVLAEDAATQRVSLLVRLAPGAAYPPHRHTGIEELWLLDGELWIGDRLLRPGDYNRAEAGTSDRVVRSDTGCACILIASTLDAFG